MKNKCLLWIFYMAIFSALISSSVNAGYILSDIDRSGDIDLTDIVLLLQLSSGIEPSVAVNLDADCDGDKKLGVAEAILGMRVIMGEIPLADISIIKVNSLEDSLQPENATVTLRQALEEAAPNQRIIFSRELSGETISLTHIGEAHSILKGEVMGMRETETGPVSYLVGYYERDYGASALYARKNVHIDASDLPDGVTIQWDSSGGQNARVLAVYGDLVLRNVTITGGSSTSIDISDESDPDAQPWTLARGGGVAVWGKATFEQVAIYNNRCVGDFESSRDRGAFGGGVYANVLDIKNSVISGNTVLGAGAAGGGIFSVGGAGVQDEVSTIVSSSITGNRIQGLFTYGGGIYSDGGGIGNLKYLRLENSTIAWNSVSPAPAPELPPFLLGMGYWRGGGVYMSNGYLQINSCTVVENEVNGIPRTDSLGKSNLAGGIAATIGDAHAVEQMQISQSIITGNIVNELTMDGSTAHSYDHDIFTGSLLHFRSLGYNRIGVIDFNQMLVPVGEQYWKSLVRKHFPQTGDLAGVVLSDAVDFINGVRHSESIISTGVNVGFPVLLSYYPHADLINIIPSSWRVEELYAEYDPISRTDNTFLSILLSRLEVKYSLNSFAADFTTEFEGFLQAVDLDTETEGNQSYTDPDGVPILTLVDTHWFGPIGIWPSLIHNYPYIEFWHKLDVALLDAGVPGLGVELLGETQWSGLFSSGALVENELIKMRMINNSIELSITPEDQLGISRPISGLGDIGSMEVVP